MLTNRQARQTVLFAPYKTKPAAPATETSLQPNSACATTTLFPSHHYSRRQPYPTIHSMASSPPPDFEHNARAMRRVIEHLLEVGNFINRVLAVKPRAHPRFAGTSTDLPRHISRASIRIDLLRDTQLADLRAHDKQFKDSLNDATLSDPVALDLHMNHQEAKLRDVGRKDFEKLMEIGATLGVRPEDMI
ncbi:hypothetical protein NX059_007344 [Plenodomus lindquistii]|nr:hypothetical protein NX059_007344 [Plenodomus lindquistii]